MDKIIVRFDPGRNTLLVWFDDPDKMAYLSPIEDDSPGDLHLIKDDNGRVIGFEGQFYNIPAGTIAIETETASFVGEPAARLR
jgi:hypothetical protein